MISSARVLPPVCLVQLCVLCVSVRKTNTTTIMFRKQSEDDKKMQYTRSHSSKHSH
jgi:hypothetical protein